MDNERKSRQHEQQLEEHSLPGTNQAGKAIPRAETEELADEGATQHRAEDQERLEEHSLPGTNQAGKPIADR